MPLTPVIPEKNTTKQKEELKNIIHEEMAESNYLDGNKVNSTYGGRMKRNVPEIRETNEALLRSSEEMLIEQSDEITGEFLA